MPKPFPEPKPIRTKRPGGPAVISIPSLTKEQQAANLAYLRERLTEKRKAERAAAKAERAAAKPEPMAAAGGAGAGAGAGAMPIRPLPPTPPPAPAPVARTMAALKEKLAARKALSATDPRLYDPIFVHSATKPELLPRE